jgi:hypothetical protein
MESMLRATRSLQANSGNVKISHDLFLPHPPQFTIHTHPPVQRYAEYAIEKESFNK